MDKEIVALKHRVNKQELDNNLLTSWADVLYQEQKSMQEEVFHNKNRQMQNELVCGGIKQVRKENCKCAAIDFFESKVGVTVPAKDVWMAYRKGSATTKTVEGRRIRCPPQMIVRMAPSLKDEIMKNAKNLKGKSDPDEHFKYFVFPHLPEAFRAARAKYQPKIEDTRKKNAGKRLKIKIR